MREASQKKAISRLAPLQKKKKQMKEDSEYNERQIVVIVAQNMFNDYLCSSIEWLPWLFTPHTLATFPEINE